jgi:hypothetical protein
MLRPPKSNDLKRDEQNLNGEPSWLAGDLLTPTTKHGNQVRSSQLKLNSAF